MSLVGGEAKEVLWLKKKKGKDPWQRNIVVCNDFFWGREDEDKRKKRMVKPEFYLF